MNGSADIRDQAHLSGNQILDLNFINSSGPYVFRKYYRSGLRSLIFEVLSARDVLRETTGEWDDGIKVFPRARPVKMLRILRSRFKSKEAVLSEIKKYRVLLNCLGPDLIAESEEFMVDYRVAKRFDIVLCGLQEFVDGEILDPWRLSGRDRLKDLFTAMSGTRMAHPEWHRNVEKNVARFVQKIRQMITDTGYIPDLAGIGNLILTRDGRIKLVDINNIVQLKRDDVIFIDDKGYPSCDVSIEVLSLLERDLLKKDSPMGDDPLYRYFLTPERSQQVKLLEKKFYKSL